MELKQKSSVEELALRYLTLRRIFDEYCLLNSHIDLETVVSSVLGARFVDVLNKEV